MRVMYIMPRFHTNLAPTVEGWIKSGNEVEIVTCLKGRIEDYSNVMPVVAGYAPSFNAIYKMYLTLGGRRNPVADAFSLRYGYPSKRKIKKLISEFEPDVVILREKSIYSIICEQICRKMRIKSILYNQSPFMDSKEKLNRDFSHRIVDSLTPSDRITPVYKYGKECTGKVRDINTSFAPFVMQPHLQPGQKEYFSDDKIHILEIGKYEKRKNHFMMVEVFERLLAVNSDIELTIVGEKTNSFHEDYYARLNEAVLGKGLEEKITLKFNLSKDDIDLEYRKADIFVLPSTGEPAAISPIEAMSYSIPSISGDGNGTADYIVDGVTGYIFEDNNETDLYNKLTSMVNSKKMILEMGKNAYNRVAEYCSFDKYYEAIENILDKQ